MNCKPGDLAVFVRSSSGNEGRIVCCLRLATQAELDAAWFQDEDGPVWVIDKAIQNTGGDRNPLARDCNLRPINNPGDDAVDESLLWLPSPTKELA